MNAESGDIILDAVEARVLGSLVEKEITTPDYYPLSLNALVNACNQSSNRDPIVTYGEPVVRRALESLRDKKLAFIFEGAASRVPKFGHKFAESFNLSRPETAVMCILMLRGPQTVGEIRGRTGRLHAFASLGEVEAVLEGLKSRSPRPLVAQLPRQSGFKESRFAYLLAGEPASESPASTPPAVPILGGTPAEGDRIARLELEIDGLRRELADVKTQLAEFKRQLE